MLDWANRAARIGKNKKKADSSAPAMQGGLVAGTLVATQDGWKPVESVCAGDLVMTFDDGVQEVIGVTRRLYPMPSSQAGNVARLRPLLAVPAGVIGNRRQLLLPEGQAVLVESDFAEQMLGDPFAAMDASELVGLPGVRKIMPEDRVVVVTMSFAEDQMIFVEGQALAHCPNAGPGQPMSLEEAIWPEEHSRYTVLSHDDAEIVVAGMASTAEQTDPIHPARMV